MDTEANFDNQLSAESSATFIGNQHSVNHLATQAQATFTIAQSYIDLASALSEAVPPIAPAIQEILPTAAKQSDIASRFILKEADTQPSPATVVIMRQETEQFKASLQVIASDCRNMLMEQFEEPLRQARMSFNVALWIVPGFLIAGLVIVIIGVIVAVLAHNALFAVPTTIGGCISEAIGIYLNFNKENNDRLEPNKKYLLFLTQFLSAGEYIDKICDVELRDKSYAELAKEITDMNKRII